MKWFPGPRTDQLAERRRRAWFAAPNRHACVLNSNSGPPATGVISVPTPKTTFLLLACFCLCALVGNDNAQAAETLLKLSLGAQARSDDFFGRSVAIDGSTLVVGVPEYDVSSSSGNGAVAVFQESGASWVRTHLLTASDTYTADVLGQNVALSGDVLIASAANVGLLTPAVWSGATYVWERNGSGWRQAAKLIPSDATEYQVTGQAADVDGPTKTVVCGARFDNDRGDHAGSAYVFRKMGTNWVQAQELFASDARPDDSFGFAVAISGKTIAVGTPYTDDIAESSGAVYFFEDTGAGFAQTAKLVASDAAYRNLFGYSVDIDGDTLVAGASRADNGVPGSARGAAYVFRRLGGIWTEVAKLVGSDTANADELGRDVAVRGSFVLVGAPYADPRGGGSGAAYLFGETSTGLWEQIAKLLPDDGSTNDNFGLSVALGGTVAVCGAENHDLPVSNAGAVYVTCAPCLNYEQWADFKGLGGTDREVAADPDGDGHPNSAECAAMTDPLDQNSVLRLVVSSRDPVTSRVTLHWPTIPNVLYDLQRSDSLATWTTLARSFKGDGSVMTFVDTNAPSATRNFYRLVVP